MSEQPAENPKRPAGKLDSVLADIGGKLSSAETRPQLVSGCIKGVRVLLRWTVFAYCLVALLQALLMRFVGEKNIFFAFSLYLPPAIWAIPAGALAPLCLVFLEWRGLAVCCATLLLGAYATFDFKPRLAPRPTTLPEKRDQSTLVVLTNNRGQHANHSMKPFKNEVRPDVMVFQEAGSVSARYLADPDYAEFKHGRDTGEFACVSKFPVLSMDPVEVETKALARTSSTQPPKTEKTIVAARVVIDFNGRQIVIYNVHLPSPRDTLRYYFRGAFIYGLIGIPGTPFAAKREANQEGWDIRTEMLTQLLARAAKETDPVILAGDFNMPSPGRNHGLVTASFNDAHEKAGAGFGFTFPGMTHNPLSLGGPWMRIDYVFSSTKSWTTRTSIAELDRPSQHRATAAELVLR